KNHQLKVGIVHLVRRQKKIRVQLRFKVVGRE
ncbi:LOW QUALITY PROTEIN: XAGE1B isoform 2, partial [Pongo abelii]